MVGQPIVQTRWHQARKYSLTYRRHQSRKRPARKHPGQSFPNAGKIVVLQTATAPDNQGVVECEDLPTDQRRLLQTCFCPRFQETIIPPTASLGAGDHRKNTSPGLPLEVGRGKDQGWSQFGLSRFDEGKRNLHEVPCFKGRHRGCLPIRSTSRRAPPPRLRRPSDASLRGRLRPSLQKGPDPLGGAQGFGERFEEG